MIIELLGAHNCESESTRLAGILIDEVLALDAGAFTSRLSFAAQLRTKAVLLTHQHYDHVRDIPAIGMNFYLHGATLDVCSTQPVLETLRAHLLNGSLYPNYLETPPEKPTMNFRLLEPGRPEEVHGYRLLPVRVNHAVPTVGYQVTAPDGTAVFYTSDTGSDLADAWRQVSPRLLIIEVTAPNRFADFARSSQHLTPALLGTELETFRKLKGYLPHVVTVHMNPMEEREIREELAAVAASVGAAIQPGYEGLRIEL